MGLTLAVTACKETSALHNIFMIFKDICLLTLLQNHLSYFVLFSLVVGAPKFDTSSYQEKVSEAGAVFRCTMDGDNQCRLVRFDSKGMCNS